MGSWLARLARRPRQGLGAGSISPRARPSGRGAAGAAPGAAWAGGQCRGGERRGRLPAGTASPGPGACGWVRLWAGAEGAFFGEGEWGNALRVGSGPPWRASNLCGGFAEGGFQARERAGGPKVGRRRPLQQGIGSVSAARWRDAAGHGSLTPGDSGGARAPGTRSCPDEGQDGPVDELSRRELSSRGDGAGREGFAGSGAEAQHPQDPSAATEIQHAAPPAAGGQRPRLPGARRGQLIRKANSPRLWL